MSPPRWRSLAAVRPELMAGSTRRPVAASIGTPSPSGSTWATTTPTPRADRRDRRRHRHLRRPPRRRLAAQLRQLHPRPATQPDRALRLRLRADHADPHTGQTIQAGEPIATFIPGGGIETGFAAAPGSPVSTRAATLGQQATTGDAGANRTYCGQAMSDLIQRAHGPAGLTEGRPVIGTSS
jgi:hypothetical protein